jgi:hypothetical protein
MVTNHSSTFVQLMRGRQGHASRKSSPEDLDDSQFFVSGRDASGGGTTTEKDESTNRLIH